MQAVGLSTQRVEANACKTYIEWRNPGAQGLPYSCMARGQTATHKQHSCCQVRQLGFSQGFACMACET